MLSFLPTRSDAENHSATTQIVECSGLTNEEGGMTKRERSDQRTKTDVLGMFCQVGKCHDQLQRVLIGRECVGEMVRAIQCGKTQRLNLGHQAFPARPSQSHLPLDLQRDCNHLWYLLFFYEK